jgi:hypothetical protein
MLLTRLRQCGFNFANCGAEILQRILKSAALHMFS